MNKTAPASWTVIVGENTARRAATPKSRGHLRLERGGTPTVPKTAIVRTPSVDEPFNADVAAFKSLCESLRHKDGRLPQVLYNTGDGVMWEVAHVYCCANHALAYIVLDGQVAGTPFVFSQRYFINERQPDSYTPIAFTSPFAATNA